MKYIWDWIWTPPNFITGSSNAALNKPATQSSTLTAESTSFLADRAVDGDQDSFSYTAVDQHPSWWKVDLQYKYSIEGIQLIVPAFQGIMFYIILEMYNLLYLR